MDPKNSNLILARMWEVPATTSIGAGSSPSMHVTPVGEESGAELSPIPCHPRCPRPVNLINIQLRNDGRALLVRLESGSLRRGTAKNSSSSRQINIKAEGIALTGSPSALAQLLQALKISKDQNEDDEPDKEKSPKKKSDGAMSPVRCRAMKADGTRCRHTSSTSAINQGLCHSHRNWVLLGRPLAQ